MFIKNNIQTYIVFIFQPYLHGWHQIYSAVAGCLLTSHTVNEKFTNFFRIAPSNDDVFLKKIPGCHEQFRIRVLKNFFSLFIIDEKRKKNINII